jgi:pSer/pThr/pTyr-binding forkhead associated (FHA) protein
VTCPQCGTANNAGFKFCGTCGFLLQGKPASSPQPPVQAPPVQAAASIRGTLVVIRPDGTEGDSIPFDERTVLGRETIPQFAADSYLSPRHATLHFEAGALRVRDAGSLNGVYLRIERDVPVELVDGSVFRVGQEIVAFERYDRASGGTDGLQVMGSPRAGLIGRICLVVGRETYGNCYSLPLEGLHLGRERGDILFPDDGYVSGLHARIHVEGGKVFLTDVGSSNGTFIRVAGEASVPNGSLLLIGQQLLRVEY